MLNVLNACRFNIIQIMIPMVHVGWGPNGTGANFLHRNNKEKSLKNYFLELKKKQLELNDQLK